MVVKYGRAGEELEIGKNTLFQLLEIWNWREKSYKQSKSWDNEEEEKKERRKKELSPQDELPGIKMGFYKMHSFFSPFFLLFYRHDSILQAINSHTAEAGDINCEN